MKHINIFEQNKTNMVSQSFPYNVSVAGFNLKPQTYEIDGNGCPVFYDGDYVYFEKLLFDDKYGYNCCEINEAGVLASTPFLDNCGCLIKLTACNNQVTMDEPGIYRAIYVGDGRPDANVVYYTNNSLGRA